MDEDQKPPEAFMTALVTEHFVLQGIRSTLTAESASRAAITWRRLQARSSRSDS